MTDSFIVITDGIPPSLNNLMPIDAAEAEMKRRAQQIPGATITIAKVMRQVKGVVEIQEMAGHQ